MQIQTLISRWSRFTNGSGSGTYSIMVNQGKAGASGGNGSVLGPSNNNDGADGRWTGSSNGGKPFTTYQQLSNYF